MAVAFAALTFSRGTIGQAAIASYFAASMLFLLKGFDRLLRNALLMLAARRRWLILPAALARIAILFGIGLPYIMAAGLTYRPKVIDRDDPSSRFHVSYEPISFKAADGIGLVGWWIPAIGPSGETSSGSTVVICHGSAVGMASALPLAVNFVPRGFNVLMFDFRAHGGSDGQIVSLATMNAAMCSALLGGCVTRIHCNRRRSSASVSTRAEPH